MNLKPIQADGQSITWTQDGNLIETTGRIDVDECTDPTGTNPCATQTGTTCYNTEPGYSCNCNIADADSLTGADQWQWIDATGTLVTIQIAVNNAVVPKASVSFTLSDGTTTTGTLLGNTVTFMNPVMTERTGTVTKNADGTQSITWDNADTWNRIEPTATAPVQPSAAPGTAPTGTPSPQNSLATTVTSVSITPTAAVTQSQLAPSSSATPGPATQGPSAPTVQAPVSSPVGPGGGTITGTGNNPSATSGTATGDPHFRIRNGFKSIPRKYNKLIGRKLLKPF